MKITSVDPALRRSRITYLASASRATRCTSERVRTGPRCSRTVWKPAPKRSPPKKVLTLAKRVQLFTLLLLLTGTRMIKSVLNAQKTERCTPQFANHVKIHTMIVRTGTKRIRYVKLVLNSLVMKIAPGTRTHRSVSPAAPASHQTWAKDDAHTVLR